MAPPKLDLVARTVESDPAFMLLYFALKHTDEGKIIFLEVANSMGPDTANAAYVDILVPLSHERAQTDRNSKKRYGFWITVQDEGASSDSVQDESPKQKAAPKKGRGPPKKQRVAKAQNVAMNMAWREDLEDEEDDSDENAAEIKSKLAISEGKMADEQVETEEDQ